MTNEQFNQIKLPVKLDFKSIECARLVHVHRIALELALRLAGAQSDADVERAKKAVEMIKEKAKH